MKKLTNRTLLLLVLLVFNDLCYSQIRIDKQQCFGGYGGDNAFSIVEEEDFLLIAGNMRLKHATDLGGKNRQGQL